MAYFSEVLDECNGKWFSSLIFLICVERLGYDPLDSVDEPMFKQHKREQKRYTLESNNSHKTLGDLKCQFIQRQKTEGSDP